MSVKTDFEQEVRDTKKKKEAEERWLSEELDVEFYNLEEPGLSVSFSYGTTKNVKKYQLFHGGKYKLPRRVVQHLETRGTPMYKWVPNGEGGLEKQLIGKKSRFQCRQTFN